MKFGIALNSLLGFPLDASDVIQSAQEAEKLGFHSVVVADHVVIPKTFDASLYPAGVFSPDTPWYDPFVMLAAIASATTKVRLTTGIAVLLYRPPIQQASAMATLDFVSGGRFVFGAGIGWMPEEFEALGVPFAERAQRADEYIEVIKLLWSGSGGAFHGSFIDFKGGRISPLPIQRPHPPILIGGETPAALRRIARYGDGFYMNWKTYPEFELLVAQLSVNMAHNGRKVSGLYMQLAALEHGLVSTNKSKLRDYEALGLKEIIYVPKCRSVEEGFNAMRKFADEFI
jgi:probable F420-dependent oxidoreductase